MPDPSLDKRFNLLLASDYRSFPKLYIEIEGHSLSASYGADPYAFSLSIAVQGRGYGGEQINVSDYPIKLGIEVRGSGIVNVERTNWVAWSQIGSANFEISRTNDAGYMPMSWPGYVYQIRKLGKNGIVYGSGGVSMMYPVGQPMATFGFMDLLHKGIKSTLAVSGDEFKHFFITHDGYLYRQGVEGRPEKLGYKRLLSQLREPVLLWDKEQQKLYISDERNGYIYNDQTLGGWLPGVTGILLGDDSLQVVSPFVVNVPRVELVTTTFDFGSRGRKSLEGVELGIESDVPVYVAYEYRYEKSQMVRSTKWVRTSPDGYARLLVTATEFRVKIRTEARAYFRLHYLNMFVKYPDRRFQRAVRANTGDSI